MFKKSKLFLDNLPEDCADPFLVYLGKKNRNLNKKLRDIE